MTLSGSPLLNCCRSLHLSPVYVPHETNPRASISPRARAPIPGLRPEPLSPLPALLFFTLLQHADAALPLPTP